MMSGVEVMMRLGYALALSAPLLLHPCVSTAAAGSAVERARACVNQSDDAQRLACYDAALGVGSVSDSPAGANGVNPPVVQNSPASPAPSPATADPTATESFGYVGDIARDKVDREAAAAPKLKMLQARITAIERLPLGEFVVTLDNGQVWRQKAKQSIGPLHVGDQVTIRAGALGSFRLSGSSNRSTLVQRVK
jgi:hypothetical protein